jgi:hypothetical protein
MFLRPFGEFFFFVLARQCSKHEHRAQTAPHCLHSVFSFFLIFFFMFRSSHLANSAAQAALKKAAYAETHIRKNQMLQVSLMLLNDVGSLSVVRRRQV